MRSAVLTVGALFLGTALLLIAGVWSPPLTQRCATGLDRAACDGAVDAVLRRGLPGFHPLILAARVTPGEATEPGELGHRATVDFDLLGVPGTTAVTLHFDQGGHWGGESDRGELELAAWALLPLVVASSIGIGLLMLAWRRSTAGAAP